MQGYWLMKQDKESCDPAFASMGQWPKRKRKKKYEALEDQ